MEPFIEIGCIRLGAVLLGNVHVDKGLFPGIVLRAAGGWHGSRAGGRLGDAG